MRIVARGKTLVVDESATLPGRGAWLHPTHECFSLAVRRSAFRYALKLVREPDMHTVENRLNG